MSKQLFLGADNIIFANAKDLRNRPTVAEDFLWGYLKNNQLGCRFRRLHPLGMYIADLYCHKYKLVIEIDGSIHNLPDVAQNDLEKEEYFKDHGITTIRFNNTQVFENVNTVLNEIKKIIDSQKEDEVKLPLQGEGGNLQVLGSNLQAAEGQKLPLKGAGGVGIINYGAGNIFSLTSALDRLGISYGMINHEDDFEQFDRYIIPGVGHAGAAMEKLQQTGLVPKIKSLTKPTLGVCVGMQLLTSYSEEGDAKLLNIIPVNTLKFKETPGFKVPHTGWNNVNAKKDNPLFADIPAGTHFYFVHSYFIEYNSVYTLASTNYMNMFSASIWHNNFFGVQFHPEKSGEYGETLLKNFSKI